MKKLFLLGILVVFLFAGCVQKIPYDKIVSCSSDEDCILVSGRGCCACETAINKQYEDYWNKRTVQSCPGRECEMCPEWIYVKCVDGKCKGIHNTTTY